MKMNVFVFIAGIFIFNFAEASNLKIAIVHSYNPDLNWTNEVEKGFLAKLGSIFDINVVYRNYLNAKNLTENEFKNRAQAIVNELKHKHFDLLFITDDNAYDLVGKLYFNTHVSVVFAGINSPLSEFGKTEKSININAPSNLFGVLEKYEVLPLFKLIKRILPNAKKLILLSDNSKTAEGVLENIENELINVDDSNILRISKIIKSNDLHIWEKQIKEAEKDDILIVLPFSNVKKKDSSIQLKLNEFAHWLTSISKVPEFATANLSLSNNFFATVGILPYEHGQDAANVFIDSKVSAKKTRIISKSYARLKFNFDRVKELNVKIPLSLLAYSYALTNKGIK